MNGVIREWMEERLSNATNPSVLLFITRRGIVHAAREGRHLHGGHCLVRTALLVNACTQSGKPATSVNVLF